jgi:hypothetical protein
MLNTDDCKHLYNIGYYECNNVFFYSKVKASIYANTVKKPIKWIYNDDLFSIYNWRKEPNLNLDELYNKRARQLREKYDYLILSFSGGADSYNVAMSFIRQGLLIDEIVTNHLTKGAERITILDTSVIDPWNLNAEYYLNAIPRLKEIEILSPKTKITTLDTTDSTIASLTSKKEDWILDRKDNLNFAMTFRYNHFYFDSVKKQFDKNFKIGIITGLEKPRTCLKGNQFYFTINDTLATNMSGIHDFNEYPNAIVEHFYWSRDSLDIMCKQSHVVKRWLEKNNKYYENWRLNSWQDWRLFKEKLVRDLVYTTWNPEWFQVEKALSGWHTEHDDWAHKLMCGTQELDVWNEGINYIAKIAPDFIDYDKFGRPDRLKNYYKYYYIGDVKLGE